MRLCFLVNVRNAIGRSAVAGISTGSILGLFGFDISEIGGGFGRIGNAGVPNAGEDDGIGLAL